MTDARTPRFPGGDGTTATGERGPATAESPWPVALLGAKLRDYIDRLGTIWVEGQITQWGVSGGNVYGKLKDLDADATVGFTVWSSVRAKIPADLKQGDHVVVLMKANYWLKGGSLTMQVLAMKHVGLGDLLERLERLRAQLADEGLFDARRKKPLPFLPHCIGLVTGKDSDAENDVLRNAQLRWPQVEFRVVHAAVQGDRAVGEVVAAIQKLDTDPDVDVIVVARGGGDFQNLLAFSDERVVRAAAAAVTPIVSAIGHEADRPLLDDVADLRASTPTDAAKRVVPDVTEQSALVGQLRSRIAVRLSAILSTETHRLDGLRSRPALAQPSWIIDARAEDLTRYVSRGVDLVERVVERQERFVAESTSRLRALSPQRTLARGYSITQRADGAIVRTAADAPDSAVLRITTADGAIGAVSTGPASTDEH
ncbi:exodeoxyribonuclease VII large subunit [Labedella gwakjiensis]|uniref:Exodeoxyribonuclease 7 large subunit n=1 Tax=Labedella gwakjiensis TaxID=390269 RepID=A0A2P8H1A4_9MICO|nr:exodeoxyribonuclease VII large subunit [Labedella gwakjiensis]